MSSQISKDEVWFAFRVFHNKINFIKEKLVEDGIQFFVPTRLVKDEGKAPFIYHEEAIIPSLIFIRTSENYMHKFKAHYTTYLSVYKNTATNKAAIIPDREMDIFMSVLLKGCIHLESVDERIVKGSHVRIIGGLFKGSEGYITRIHGTKRFIVMIKGVAAVATTFIPRCFIEKIT